MIETNKPRYKKEITGVLLGALWVFFLLSCVSYHPSDNTFFHFTSQSKHIENWCGLAGANLAAFLFYVLGFACYFFLITLGVSVFLMFNQKTWEDIRPRVGSLIMLQCAATMFCTIFNIGILHTISGGVLGLYLTKTFYYAIGQHGTNIALFCFTWIGIILLFQVPIIPFIKTCSHLFYKYTELACTYLFSHIKMWGKNLLHRTKKNTQQSESAADITSLNITKTSNNPESQQTDQITQDPETDMTYWQQILDGTNTNQPETTNDQESTNVQPALQALTEGIFDNDSDKKNYVLPNSSVFEQRKEQVDYKAIEQDAIIRGKKLEEKLLYFDIKGKVTAIKPGPLITLFEYKPEIDSKISKIIALEDDLAMALATTSLRILAPIPGKDAIGFEIANNTRHDVFLADILKQENIMKNQTLPTVLGVDVTGNPIITNLASMPHVLIGGTTGSGKSVGLNGMIISLLCACTPEQLKIILIDPKRLEFASYAHIPHLLFPVITNPTQATSVLRWVVQEMEHRYETMSRSGVRSIKEYLKLWDSNPTPLDNLENPLPKLPYLVVVIDELADLMMVAGKEVEICIVRIAQMARAAGIHMMVATQRPSVDVVTGLIKVNFPSRISFRVSSKVDSRTILDAQGAEKLLGRGDMLFMTSSSPELKRIHGAYISDKEILNVTQWWKNQETAKYLDLANALGAIPNDQVDDIDDALYQDICQYVKSNSEISISLIQRQFRIGFNRSARIIDKLELDGIVAPAQGSKPRKVLR